MAATFKAAFAEAGYTLKNQRQDWSAMREDGRVALTIWRDQIDRESEPWLYGPKFSDPALWSDKPGNLLRIAHLQHVLETGQTEIDLILCEAVDTEAEPRKIKVARHWWQRIGVLRPDSLDPQVGTFEMELRPTQAAEAAAAQAKAQAKAVAGAAAKAKAKAAWK